MMSFKQWLDHSWHLDLEQFESLSINKQFILLDDYGKYRQFVVDCKKEVSDDEVL